MPAGQAFCDKEAARKFVQTMDYPIMIKPTDSSGSKGVTKLVRMEEFDKAFDEAMSYSLSKNVIIEKFIAKKGYQIDGDGFIKDGKIVFFGVMDQHNNVIRNPHAPIGLSTPSVQDAAFQTKAYNLIQAIFSKLGMKFGAFNFEYIIGEDGEVYILEIGPRNGGNFIADTIKYALGVDMIEASVRAAVGDDYSEALEIKQNRTASSYVVHAMKSGMFKGLNIHDEIAGKIVEEVMFVSEGDRVEAFRNGGDSIGVMILSFESVEEMNEMMDCMWQYVEVMVE
jgi:biotin carboxylase